MDNNNYNDPNQQNNMNQNEGSYQQNSQPHSFNSGNSYTLNDGKKKKKSTGAIVAACLAGGIGLGALAGFTTYTLNNNRNQVVAEAAQLPEETAVVVNEEAAAQSTPRPSFSIESSTTALNNGAPTKSAEAIYAEIGPSIVTVSTSYTVQQGRNSRSAEGSGSGVIISDEGYVLTNSHVVSGAESINIITSDGKEHEATLIGRDSTTDLAVLEFNAQNKYKSAPLGNSADAAVGQTVYAIGNPLGELATSMTNGMISAVNRNVDMQNMDNNANITMNFIQMTAAISPGNSGGALINSYGEVIGITTAKSYGEAVEGIGYAIPIDDAKPIIEDLVQNGYVTGRPVIGLQGQNITEEAAQLTNVPEGVYIVGVQDNTPASEAGLLVGDIIVAVDGKNIKSVEEINEIKNGHTVGDTLSFTIYRKGEKQTVKLVLGEEKPDTFSTTTQDQENPIQEQAPQQNPNDYYQGEQMPEDLQEFFESIFG